MNVRYVFCAKRCVVASCACDERWASTAVASDCAHTHTHRIPQRLAPPHRVFLSHPPASCDHIHCSPQFCRGRVREGRQQFERAMMHEHSDCHMRNIYARTHTQPTYIHTIVPTMLITGRGRDTSSVLSLSLPTRHASLLAWIAVRSSVRVGRSLSPDRRDQPHRLRSRSRGSQPTECASTPRRSPITITVQR